MTFKSALRGRRSRQTSRNPNGCQFGYAIAGRTKHLPVPRRFCETWSRDWIAGEYPGKYQLIFSIRHCTTIFANRFDFLNSIITVKYEPRFHIVLHNPEIPQNTGAIGRTCVALQAKLWLVRPLGFRVDDKTVRRAGLDYWQHLQWQTSDHWDDCFAKLPSPRKWYFSRFAERDFRSADFQPGDALVFGSESAGLPRSITREHRQELLRIPTSDYVRSLNLSAAVAVAGFEWQRQCGDGSGVDA